MVKSAVFSVVFLAFAVAASGDQLVTNGGFETGDLTGWTLTGNVANDFLTIDPSFAFTGDFGLQIGPFGSDAFLSQTLPTVSGAMYTLSYALQSGGGATNDFGVSWGGTPVAGAGFVNAGPFRYKVFTFSLVAPGPNTVLKFNFRQDPDYWYLDAVSVLGPAAVPASVPEPATTALLGIGMLVLAVRRSRLQSHP